MVLCHISHICRTAESRFWISTRWQRFWMSHEKPHTDTARAENSRPTVSARRAWFPKKRCLPFCMAQNHRNPRLAPANMLPVGRRWSRLNLRSFRQMIWPEYAESRDIDEFYAEIRAFSVFAPDSRCLIFTKFIDISVLSCWKTCENGAKGNVLHACPCSANASVTAYAPFWAIFVPAVKERQRISAWKPTEGLQGKHPKFGRLYASAVKRSRPKMGR